MADCIEVRILNRLLVVLAGINGAAGGYTYDFSGTDSVIYGQYLFPPTVPSQIFVEWLPESIEHGISMGDYKPTAHFSITVYVPATDLTPRAKTSAILNALADITKALEADRNVSAGLGGIVSDIIVRSKGEILGDALDDIPNLAMGICTLELWWRRRPGTT